MDIVHVFVCICYIMDIVHAFSICWVLGSMGTGTWLCGFVGCLVAWERPLGYADLLGAW